jgi:hypothetical protein
MALAAGSLEEWSIEAAPVVTSLLDIGGLGDRLAGPGASSTRSICARIRSSMAAASVWLREHPCPDPSIGASLVDSIARYREAADRGIRDTGPIDPIALEAAGTRFIDDLHDVLGQLGPGAVHSA